MTTSCRTLLSGGNGMTRRARLIFAMVLTAPFLLFTLMLAAMTWTLFVVSVGGPEWWAENGTEGTIWVTPVTFSARGPVSLPHYPARLTTLSAMCHGELPVEPGERRLLVIDVNVAMDLGGNQV